MNFQSEHDRLSPLNRIAALITEVFKASACAIYERPMKSDTFLLVAYYYSSMHPELVGAEPVLTRPEVVGDRWEGMTAFVGFAGQALHAENCREGAMAEYEGRTVKVEWDIRGIIDHNTTSFVGVPVCRGGQTVGIIRLTNKGGCPPFHQDHIIQLYQYAPLAEAILDLERSRRALVDGMMRLEEASEPEAFEYIVDHAIQLVHGDRHRAALFLLDPTAEKPHYRCVAPKELLDNPKMKHTYTLSDDGLTPEVLRSGRHLLSVNLKNDCAEGGALHGLNHQSTDAETRGGRSNSWLGVPILDGKNVIGAIRVSSEKHYAFFQPDVETLRALADVVHQRLRLEERTSLFDKLVERTNRPIIHINHTGRVCYANDAARELFGDAMRKGADVTEVAYRGQEALAKATQAAIRDAAEKDLDLESFHVVCFRKTDDGTHLVVPVRLTALRVIVQNKLHGSIGIIEDLRGDSALDEVLAFGSKSRGGITTDREMQKALKIIAVIKRELENHPLDNEASPNPEPVLIQGETGTGKEIIAASIQEAANPKKKELLTVNCAAFPDQLLEAELFGYEPRIFTGASPGGRDGIFARVRRSALFLDEIHHLSPSAQAKILRVVDTRKYRKIGNLEIEEETGKFQLISATNRSLDDEVECGRFQHDLQQRLTGYQISLPPLKERRSDIMQVAMHFLDKETSGTEDSPLMSAGSPLSFSSDAVRAMLEYEWPGNVRELHRAVALARRFYDSDPDKIQYRRLIQISHLPQRVQDALPAEEKEVDFNTFQPGEPPVSSAHWQAVMREAKTTRQIVERLRDAIESSGADREARTWPEKLDILAAEMPELKNLSLKKIRELAEEKYGAPAPCNATVSNWKKKGPDAEPGFEE